MGGTIFGVIWLETFLDRAIFIVSTVDVLIAVTY